MFPIPILFIATDSGVIPLPSGIIKKVITLDYPDNSGNPNNSLAILLNDGRLFTQGSNLFGEIADGTRTPRFNTFYLAATNANDIFTGDRCFIIKYNALSWQYAGLLAGLVGATAAGGSDVVATTWTSLPSSITSVVSLATLKEVRGGYNNTLWWMNSGQLYGSGQNTVGSLGSGNTAEIPTPRSISTVALKFDAGYNQCTYLNNVGALRVCGATNGVLGNGATNTVVSFTTAIFPETVYVKDYVTSIAQTLVVGAATADSTENYLYTRIRNATAYSKSAELPTSFTTWQFPVGRQAFFMQAGSSYFAIGKNYTANLGLGYASAETDPVVKALPVLPEHIAKWDVAKMNNTHSMFLDLTDKLGYTGTFLVYDGNLYYSGTAKDGKVSYLFNSGLDSNQFTNITDSTYLGVKANSLTTASIGLALKGAKLQLGVTTDPAGATLFNQVYSSSAPAFMTVDQTGMMTFVDEGGFDVTLTAKNNEGTTLSDTSGGYVSTLSVYTDSLSEMEVGTTQQLVATISPDGAAALDGMIITYTTTDDTIAVANDDGLITAKAAGDCRIGCTATYQGTVIASDSSYLSVIDSSKPVPETMKFEILDYTNDANSDAFPMYQQTGLNKQVTQSYTTKEGKTWTFDSIDSWTVDPGLITLSDITGYTTMVGMPVNATTGVKSLRFTFLPTGLSSPNDSLKFLVTINIKDQDGNMDKAVVRYDTKPIFTGTETAWLDVNIVIPQSTTLSQERNIKFVTDPVFVKDQAQVTCINDNTPHSPALSFYHKARFNVGTFYFSRLAWPDDIDHYTITYIYGAGTLRKFGRVIIYKSEDIIPPERANLPRYINF